MTDNASRVHVGPASSFKEKSRQLIKCGDRNIAVFFYKGEFFALDNACYHHGGPLSEGDIEDMDGRPCVVCPWHEYHITLDTGEGLYWGLQMTPSGLPDKTAGQVVRSKGCKQRVHRVFVEQGEVYIAPNTSGPPLESDTYAEMSLANQQPSMSSPVLCERGGAVGIHSGLRSGHVLAGLSVLNRLKPRVGADPLRRVVECVRVEHVCDNTKEFFFCLRVGELPVPPVPGQYVDLELPLSPPIVRRWTVATVGKEESLFTLVVKAAPNSRGGSAWLAENALHQRLALQLVGGSFTLTHHTDRLRAMGGRVLVLSAGIGVTAPHASLMYHLEGQLARNAQRLRLAHLHTDKVVSSVARMDDFVRWHNTRGKPFTYTFRCFLTQQSMEHVAEGLQPLLVCGRRPDKGDVVNFVKEVLGDGPALAFICGPESFVSDCSSALLSCGFAEEDILTDEDGW